MHTEKELGELGENIVGIALSTELNTLAKSQELSTQVIELYELEDDDFETQLELIMSELGKQPESTDPLEGFRWVTTALAKNSGNCNSHHKLIGAHRICFESLQEFSEGILEKDKMSAMRAFLAYAEFYIDTTAKTPVEGGYPYSSVNAYQMILSVLMEGESDEYKNLLSFVNNTLRIILDRKENFGYEGQKSNELQTLKFVMTSQNGLEKIAQEIIERQRKHSSKGWIGMNALNEWYQLLTSIDGIYRTPETPESMHIKFPGSSVRAFENN